MTFRPRTALIGLAALAICAAPALGLAHEPARPPSGSAAPLVGDAGDAARVVDAFHAALKAGDTGKAARFMADDVLIFEAGRAEHSKAAYASGHLAADAKFVATATETVLSRTGGASGEMAWTTTEGRIQGRAGEKTIDRMTVETMVLRKTSAGWRIVHVHWSSGAASSPH